ncbi:MAG: zinc ribbon domain-containing protein [Candidatus Odinarchaeota archaeon]
MKKNYRKCGKILIIMILVLSTAYFFTNPFSDIKFNDENSNELISGVKLSVSDSLNLTYNDYFTFSGFAVNEIYWNFTGDPINVSIFLLILDQYSYYYSFINDTINYGLNITLYYLYFDYIVSMNTSSNSGIYYPPQADYWYVVFVNFDVIHQSTTLIHFNIDFDPYDPDPNYVTLPSFSLLNIFFIIFASLIGTMIMLMIYIGVKKRHSVYKSPLLSPYLYRPKTQPINPYIKQLKEQKLDQVKITEQPNLPLPKYCPYCGAQRDRDAVYCHQCGSKLE